MNTFKSSGSDRIQPKTAKYHLKYYLESEGIRMRDDSEFDVEVEVEDVCDAAAKSDPVQMRVLSLTTVKASPSAPPSSSR